MKKNIRVLIAVLIGLFIAGVYYYIVLPPINIHAPGVWMFLIVLLAVILVVLIAITMGTKGYHPGSLKELRYFKFKSKGLGITVKAGILIIIGVIIVFFAATILSSPILRASKYQKLLKVETRDFGTDIKPVEYNEIPLLDKDSARIVGSRVMGSMVDMVSQYEVNDIYTQINYQQTPVRVSPLEYGSILKWFTNHKKGIPAYIKIDMATQEAETVQLAEGIKYSTSDHFGRNIYRHLRFAYPTYIFDDIGFEIDDNGIPYWIAPVKKYNIGLFGGVTIGKAVLCNAVTGEMTEYDIEDIPQWVDKVSSANLLMNLYNYYGTLKHGYLNSIFGQRDCLKTTQGYNYVVLEDGVWVYTGVTSVGRDESNVGFVLMNQRTSETRYYEVPGAEEFSAMASAEGKVQNLGYKATFPLLLNVAGEPTYFMSLKDSSGLVKMYAMINIEKYQNVATGETVSQTEKNYITLLNDNGVVQEQDFSDTKEIKGKISKIAQAVLDGNSHYYVLLEENPTIFDVKVSDNISIIKYNIGDTITFSYEQGGDTGKVIKIQ